MKPIYAMSMRSAATLSLLVLLAGLPPTAIAETAEEAADGRSEACGLLTDAEVLAVQETEVVERVASTTESASFRVGQCVYRTGDLSRSVSLALSAPIEGREAAAARDYWMERFHADPVGEDEGARGEAEGEGEEGEAEGPPLVVEGLGEEAFWVGDAKTGALYALAGERFLRISVGGIPDEVKRREHTRRLVEVALARLGAESSTEPSPDGSVSGPSTPESGARETP